MSIGFIFECGPQGADIKVCEYFASQIRPGAKLVSRTLDDKLKLLADAAAVAKSLLADGCERVLIVWDLRPAWPDKKGKPSRAAERQTLLDALAQEGLQNQPVHLVCVEQELESWVLADEVKLGDFLSTAAHPYSVSRVRKPDHVQKPKAAVMNHFKAARGWRYEDRIHAVKVAQSGELNLPRLRRSASFAWFEAKLS